jgi:hypothetical protein
MITPKQHQLHYSKLVYDQVKSKGYAYLAGKPRSGKTYTAILACECSDKINRVLVLTTKKAIEGWHVFIDDTLKHKYDIINYEQAGSVKAITHDGSGRKYKVPKIIIQLKVNPELYGLVIIDESHNTGAFPKPSGRYKVISKICANLPHIHLSGTAIVESQASIYHQMNISKFSPFKHKNFYDFHKEFGEPYYIKAGGRDINQYDKVKDTLLPLINTFTIYMTQEDAGISEEFQAVDIKHYIVLSDKTRQLYNDLQDDNIVDVFTNILSETSVEANEAYKLVCDTVMKLRTSLHMLEGGAAKIDDTYIDLGNREKVNYIKEHFGDISTTGIMCHFIGERQILEKEFKYAEIYSSQSHAEGVDLSHLENFVVYSAGYSGAKYIQRRDRTVNLEVKKERLVHHLLVKGAVSEQVFKRVTKKEDFNNATYEHTRV